MFCLALPRLGKECGGISLCWFRENSRRFRVIMFGSSESRCTFADEISEDADAQQIEQVRLHSPKRINADEINNECLTPIYNKVYEKVYIWPRNTDECSWHRNLQRTENQRLLQ